VAELQPDDAKLQHVYWDPPHVRHKLSRFAANDECAATIRVTA